MANIGITSGGSVTTIEVSPPRGYSSFDIAVQNGYQGTEQEWVDLVEGFYRYNLGTSSTPPSQDRYGDAVQQGAWYFDSDANRTFVYTGVSWSPAVDNQLLTDVEDVQQSIDQDHQEITEELTQSVARMAIAFMEIFRSNP